MPTRDQTVLHRWTDCHTDLDWQPYHLLGCMAATLEFVCSITLIVC